VQVSVRYTFSCSAAGCTERDVQEYVRVREHVHVPHPVPPPGWVEIGLLGFCPRHSLVLQIDGQAMPLTTAPGKGPVAPSE
jgi:hypothetical protein